MKIKQIQTREILDSRGNPTLRTLVILESGAIGEASVPSGASTGSHEALELRDGGKRYGGLGVLKAVKNVNGEIAKLLIGIDCAKQEEIDKKMMEADGTANKSRLGANAILSVSMACARAAATAEQKPLYEYLRSTFSFSCELFLSVPMMNVLNGGKHADSGMEVQEFMIVSLQKTMAERVRAGAEIFHALKFLLQKQGFSTGVGDEGGFAPRLKNNEEALKYLVSAIKSAGYAPGKEVALAIDAAASEFFANGKYNFEGKKLSAEELSKIYLSWVKKYPLVSIEDPFAEDDWEAWKKFKSNALTVGDDLFVTNVERLKKGVKLGAANAILIKLNQIGTLTETIEAIKLAQKNYYKVIISHRSGETADTFIADLAVAVGANFIKTGSLSRSERVEKYNRLMEIEQEI
jgi:enolase